MIHVIRIYILNRNKTLHFPSFYNMKNYEDKTTLTENQQNRKTLKLVVQRKVKEKKNLSKKKIRFVE